MGKRYSRSAGTAPVEQKLPKLVRDALTPPAGFPDLADVMRYYEDQGGCAEDAIPDLVQRIETLESFINFMLQATVEVLPAGRVNIQHANAEYEWAAVVRKADTDTIYWGRSRRDALVAAWEGESA